MTGSFYVECSLEYPKLIPYKRVRRKLDNYYNLYLDLEIENSCRVDKNDILNFEKNNVVIKFIVTFSCKDINLYLSNFYKLQLEYFKILTQITQEKAQARI